MENEKSVNNYLKIVRLGENPEQNPFTDKENGESDEANYIQKTQGRQKTSPIQKRKLRVTKKNKTTHSRKSIQPSITFKDNKLRFSNKLINELNPGDFEDFRVSFNKLSEILEGEAKRRNINYIDSSINQPQFPGQAVLDESNKVAELNTASEPMKFDYGSLWQIIVSVILIPGLFLLVCYYFFVN